MALVPGCLRRNPLADMVRTSPAEHSAVACPKAVVLVVVARLRCQATTECLAPPSLVLVLPSPHIVRQAVPFPNQVIPPIARTVRQAALFPWLPIVHAPFGFERPLALDRNSANSVGTRHALLRLVNFPQAALVEPRTANRQRRPLVALGMITVIGLAPLVYLVHSLSRQSPIVGKGSCKRLVALVLALPLFTPIARWLVVLSLRLPLNRLEARLEPLPYRLALALTMVDRPQFLAVLLEKRVVGLV